MKRLVVSLAALAALACSDSGTAPTTNVISADEKAAVQQALSLSFGTDSVYASLATFVLPFIDQATPQPNGAGDTTKLAGFQLELDAGTVTAGLSGLLVWRGFHPTTQTVDSVFLVVGGGSTPPVTDSLSAHGPLDTPGFGTAWVIAQATDSSVQTWLVRTGALSVVSASFGSGTTTVLSGLTWTRSRGTMSGDFHLTAKLVPDSATTVTAAWNFASGINAVKLTIAGGP
jgi:hypothetical protein